MKKTARLAILCLAMLALAGHAHNVTIPKDIKEMSLKKVTDNVYVVHGIHAMRDQVADELSEFSDWSGFDQIGRLISFVYQQVEAAEFE